MTDIGTLHRNVGSVTAGRRRHPLFVAPFTHGFGGPRVNGDIEDAAQHLQDLAA
jgi:hypothetical protein